VGKAPSLVLLMVTRTKPPATTPPISQQVSGTYPGAPIWTINTPPVSYQTGSVTYTDRPKAVDWRDLIRKGENATTRAVAFKRSWNGDYSYLLARHKITGQYLGQIGYDNSAHTLTSGHYNEAWQLAVGDAIKSAKATQHEFDAGAFMAELRETIGFLLSPIRSIRQQSVRYHRRIANKSLWRESPASKLSRLSDYWLSYRFGVYPLYKDIDSAMLELANKSVGQPPTLPFRGKGVWVTATDAVTSGASNSVWQYYRDVITEKKTNVVIRGRVRLVIDTQIIYPPGLIRVFEDFVPSLYEGMPWSWAIDYFTNIGDILTGLTYCSCNITWANYTARTKMSIKEHAKFTENNPGYYFISSKGRNTVTTYTAWERDTTNVDQLVPRLVLKTPADSVIKMANLTAVMFQRFGK
jgi:hypothetical protein